MLLGDGHHNLLAPLLVLTHKNHWHGSMAVWDTMWCMYQTDLPKLIAALLKRSFQKHFDEPFIIFASFGDLIVPCESQILHLHVCPCHVPEPSLHLLFEERACRSNRKYVHKKITRKHAREHVMS
jgi:hypothetical protein